MTTTIGTIQMRRGTASQWSSANPVLNAGEYGFESDTGGIKIGDGSTLWSALTYVTLPGTDSITFQKAGTLAVVGAGVPFRILRPRTISKVYISVGTAPTGASLIVDVLRNGTTIFTTTANRPAITAGNTSAVSATPDVVSLVPGDRIQYAITQVGSTVAGADLCVQVAI